MFAGLAAATLTLEITLFPFGITTERSLRFLLLELIQDLPVRNVAYLMVLLDDHALPEAHAVTALGHHGIAREVRLAHIAVDAFPPVLARAFMALTRQPVIAVGERTAKRLAAVFATEAMGTGTLARGLCAVGELVANEIIEVAIEAGRAISRSVIVVGAEEVSCLLLPLALSLILL